MANLPLKQQRGQILQNKKWYNKENSTREWERTVEFGGANLNKAIYFGGHISDINRG